MQFHNMIMHFTRQLSLSPNGCYLDLWRFVNLLLFIFFLLLLLYCAVWSKTIEIRIGKHLFQLTKSIYIWYIHINTL